jgi:aspartyl-tRNA(Asn)/glutamyl-tRNA(Gln) amidotransferase subunit C
MSDFFDVRYTAHLARLNLSEAEIATFQAQLAHVLDHVEQLKKVDIDGVAPTAHANPICNVFRPDEPHSWFGPAEALENAPRHANQLFVVPKVIE